MNAQVWRLLALLTIGFVFVYSVDALVQPGLVGDYGLETTRSIALERTVARVERGMPAALARIVAGDRVRPATRSFGNRVAFLAVPTVGSRLDLLVDHHGARRRVALIAVPAPPLEGVERESFDAERIVYEILRLVMLAVAAIVVVRRPDRRDARTLASFFIALAFCITRTPRWYPLPVIAALDIVRPIVWYLTAEQALLFATRFPQPSIRGLRRVLERLAFPAFLLAALAASTTTISVFLFGDVHPPNTALNLVEIATLAFDALGLAVALIVAHGESSAVDRQRLRWFALSLMLGLCGFVPAALLETLGVRESVWLLFLPLTLVAIPIGMAYAILRHKMLDIGFAVNRALVFAMLSAIIVVAFGALEMILGKVLVSAGHVTSLVLELALSLAIGFSFQKLHARVDRFVDNVFFRDRHQAELALRHLTQQAAFITSAQTLAERTVDAVDRHAGAAESAIFLPGANGSYDLRMSSGRDAPGRVDENDPAVVAMRAFRESVDLEGAELDGGSKIPGEFAFPMLVRGEVVGILACGRKRNEERYAPDEREALATLASAVGTAFVTISTNALRAAVDRTLRGEGTMDDLRGARAAL